jgi:hypothetical protein
MKELERRDFAKQTLKWGGALTLLAALNPPGVALGKGPGGPPGGGNPLKALQKNPFLQRDDLQPALKSLYMTYDSTAPYPHKFNDVISKGQLECLELIVSKGLEKKYVEHYVTTMKPILMRVKQRVKKEGPDKALHGMFEGTTCAYQLMERIDVKEGERSFPCPYGPALERCKKWLPERFFMEWKDVCNKWCIPVWQGFANVIGVKIAIKTGETCVVKLA